MLQWNDSLALGIKEVDKQHSIFLDIVNELSIAMKEKKSHNFQGKIIDKLISYAFYHFSTEERYMVKSNFPYIEAHKKEHEDFVDKVIQFKKDYDEKKVLLSIGMINFMNKWWVNHIKVSDRKYLPYVNNHN